MTARNDAAAKAPGEARWRPSRKRPLAIVALLLLSLASVSLILAAWDLPPFAGDVQTTDNAYVRGRITVIAPQVSGYVTRVLVRDYENVARGQVLAVIDDRAYRARVEQARANLLAAEAALANSAQARAARSASLQGQVANVDGARAQLARAQADMARVDDLASDGAVSIRERDQTSAALAVAAAQLRQAQAGRDIGQQDVRTVEVGRAGLEAQVEAARALLHAAELDLEHTVIRAPESGVLGEVGTRVGAYVTNGSQLMAIVPPERWVIANFKEAQTSRMHPGQSATLIVDALGGTELRGRIERISPAAGSEFSVLKPDNATGNFVKIPQRIGIRIVVERGQRDALRLRPGMSVSVRVDTGGRP